MLESISREKKDVEMIIQLRQKKIMKMGPVRESNAPDESAKEQQVVDDICLRP